MVRLLVLAALLAASQPAYAQASFGPPSTVLPEAPATPPTTHTEHYGWQIFLADAGWMAATIAIGRTAGSEGPTNLLGLGYFATGPIVHLAHGNHGGATRSLAARALLPVLGAVVGMAYGSQDNRSEYSVLGGMIIGGGAGMVAAMVLDWTVLGKHEVAEPARGHVVAPALALTKHSATLSLAGRF